MRAVAQKVYHAIRMNGIEDNDMYTHHDFDVMADQKLGNQLAMLVFLINHEYMLVNDQHMLINVWGKGYRIAPQTPQAYRTIERNSRAIKQVDRGIVETQCMLTNQLTPAELSNRNKSLERSIDMVAYMRNPTILKQQCSEKIMTAQQVAQEVEKVVKKLLNKFEGSLKF